MEIPRGYQMPEGLQRDDYCLFLLKNIYGNKEGGRCWYEFLVDGLTKKVGFEHSTINQCVFYRKSTTILIVYVDADSILMGPNKDEIDQAFKDLEAADFRVTDEGDMSDFFLGVAYTKEADGSHDSLEANEIDRADLQGLGLQ